MPSFSLDRSALLSVVLIAGSLANAAVIGFPRYSRQPLKLCVVNVRYP